MGGVLGALLSYGVSIIVNRFVSMSDMMGDERKFIQDPFMAGICSYRLCYFCGNGSRFHACYACYEIKPLSCDPQ